MDQQLKENESRPKDIEMRLLKSLLQTAATENSKLSEINKKLQEEQIIFRDKIALSVFPIFLEFDFKPEIAAQDAYKSADAFMRVRDAGKIYEDDLIEVLQSMVKSNPNDSNLGKTLRKFITHKIEPQNES